MPDQMPAMTKPRISVVIAVRNGAATLERALDSVLDQSYDAIELIVIDGGSTDGTTAIIERHSDRIRYWVSEPDRGVCHAWNKGLDHVSGDWVCFLGADDLYHDRDVMAAVVETIKTDAGEHRVLYANIDLRHADGGIVHRLERDWDAQRRRRFRRGAMIPHPATLHHVSVFEEHGRFDEGFRIAGDYEFLLRELPDHPPLHVPMVMVDMQRGGLSDRPANRGRIAREVYRARYMHGIVRLPSWASRHLYAQLWRIWRDVHLRPRLDRLRATVARPPGGAR